MAAFPVIGQLAQPIRRRARAVVGRWAATVARSYEQRSDEDIALATVLASEPGALEYPGRYVEFLRECIKPQRHEIKEIKSRGRPASEAERRFQTVLDVLSSEVPPLAMASAQRIARVADALLANTQTCRSGSWIGDVSLHFRISSSPGRPGRLLAAIVRLMKSERCLELGTAYGLSALFMLDALERNGDRGHLSTLEGADVQFALAARMLEAAHGSRVTAHHGLTCQALPTILPTLGAIDFVFHDAGHSRHDYVTDFGLVEPWLAAGAVMLVDDIRWADPRYFTGDPECYAGWRGIVEHARVERAVEIDGSRGLILLR